VVLTRLGEGIAPCLQPGRSFTVGERFLTKWVPIEGTLSQSPAFLSATGPLSVKFTSTTIKIPANKTVFEFEKKKEIIRNICYNQKEFGTQLNIKRESAKSRV
jgi:hypothetical protein